MGRPGVSGSALFFDRAGSQMLCIVCQTCRDGPCPLSERAAAREVREGHAQLPDCRGHGKLKRDEIREGASATTERGHRSSFSAGPCPVRLVLFEHSAVPTGGPDIRGAPLRKVNRLARGRRPVAALLPALRASGERELRAEGEKVSTSAWIGGGGALPELRSTVGSRA